MTRINLLMFLVIILLVVSVFGGYAGYQSTQLNSPGTPETPGILGITQWLGNTVGFMFDMITFQISDMPAIFSIIFIFFGLMAVYLLVATVRG